MSKLYTKTGDKGTTSLYDMRRVGKHTPVFDALGDLDELSAHIGVLCSLLDKDSHKHKLLRNIQSKLLDIGSNLATVERRDRVPVTTADDIKSMENAIDNCEEANTPLREFILPGVYQADAVAHICRAVTRRAERNMWKHRNETGGSPFYTGEEIFIYMNRLSDFFFALARYLSGCRETRRSECVNI